VGFEFDRQLVHTVTKTVAAYPPDLPNIGTTIIKQDVSFVSAFEAFNSGSGDRWSPTFPVTSGLAKAYARSAMNWTDPGVRPELSLLRAVAELKDFKHIFQDVIGRFLSLRAALKAKDTASLFNNLDDVTHGILFSLEDKWPFIYRNDRGRLRRIQGREIIAAGLNADFFWKFAFAPLIKDIQAANRVLGRLSSVVEALRLVGIPYYVRGAYTDSLVYSESYSNDWRSHSTNYTATRKIVGWAATRREPFEASTLDALKALGDLRFRLSTVWELTPLSFVVDWFVSIGNALRACEGIATQNLPLTVLSSGFSTKVEITGSTIVNPFADHPMLVDIPPTVTGSFTSKGYNRVGESISPIDPIAIPPPSLRFPNLGKLWTLTELVFQAFYLGGVTKKT
jgi:hypothetical protein